MDRLEDRTVDRTVDQKVGRLEGRMADRMVDRKVGRLEGRMADRMADRKVGRLEGLTVDRKADRMADQKVGRMADQKVGLKDLVARSGAWRPSSAEPIRLPALLEPFQARGLEGCESLLLEGGGHLLLGQLEGLVPQELLLLLGGEGHLRWVQPMLRVCFVAKEEFEVRLLHPCCLERRRR